MRQHQLRIMAASVNADIEYVGSATADFSSTSIDLSGIGLLPGDLVLTVTAAMNEGGDWITPTGWTRRSSFSVYYARTSLNYKIMSSPVDTSTGALKSGTAVSVAIAFRNTKTTAPAVAYVTQNKNPPSVSFGSGNVFCLAAYTQGTFGATPTLTPPSGFTMATQVTDASSSKSATVAVAYLNILDEDNTGSYNPGSFVASPNTYDSIITTSMAIEQEA